jgi:short-subunit dehydrogenase
VAQEQKVESMTEEKKQYALITGASAGLGKAIATSLPQEDITLY